MGGLGAQPPGAKITYIFMGVNSWTGQKIRDNSEK